MLEEAVIQDGLVWIGSDWYRLVHIGLVWIGSDWYELVHIGLVWMVQIGTD